MSYCTVADVEAYFLNKKFSADDDNWLTSTEVDTYIAQEAALIDAYIKKRYSLPIADATDLLILKIINEKLVAGTIDDIFREKTEENEYDRKRSLRKDAMDLLEKIVKGEIILDGTSKDSVIKFNSEDSEGNTVEKRFKDSEIPPASEFVDRERRTVTRVT